jgi:hypothetical protein
MKFKVSFWMTRGQCFRIRISKVYFSCKINIFKKDKNKLDLKLTKLYNKTIDVYIAQWFRFSQFLPKLVFRINSYQK